MPYALRYAPLHSGPAFLRAM